MPPLPLDYFGELWYWVGQRDLSDLPDESKVLTLIRNLTRFYREEGKPYLYAGRMIPALPVAC